MMDRKQELQAKIDQNMRDVEALQAQGKKLENELARASKIILRHGDFKNGHIYLRCIGGTEDSVVATDDWVFDGLDGEKRFREILRGEKPDLNIFDILNCRKDLYDR